MSTQLQRNRETVVIDADSQCELVLDGARCARGGRAVETHHVVYRSQGGGHEVSNLLPVCNHHHRAFHDGRLKGPHHDGDLTFYAETVEGERRLWYVFREVREQLESVALHAEQQIRTARSLGTKAAFMAGEGLRQLRDFNLWALSEHNDIEPDPDNPMAAVLEYAARCGFQQSTAYAMVRVAEDVAALPEDEREEWAVTEGGFTVWRDAGKYLREMDQDDRLAVLERAREQSTKAVIESIREEFGGEPAVLGDNETVEVEFKVAGMAFQRVTRPVGESDEETVKEARKRLGGDGRFRVELTGGKVRR